MPNFLWTLHLFPSDKFIEWVSISTGPYLKLVYFVLGLCKNRKTCQQIAALFRTICLLLWLLNTKSENRDQRTSRGMDCFLSIMYLCHPCYLSHMDSPAFPFWQHWCPLGRWWLGSDVTRQDQGQCKAFCPHSPLLKPCCYSCHN